LEFSVRLRNAKPAIAAEQRANRFHPAIGSRARVSPSGRTNSISIS
jgi:hypothetical protein